MKRRSFLGCLVGGIAGVLGIASTPKPPNGDRDGACRSFRLDPATGKYWEIHRNDTKKGDTIIFFGVDEDTGELWRAYRAVADSDFLPSVDAKYPAGAIHLTEKVHLVEKVGGDPCIPTT